MGASEEKLFTRGNDKVGRSVHLFNLPVVKTCPGMTPTCQSVCYADRGHCRWPANRRANEARLATSRSPDFAARAVEELRRRGATLFRLHSSGDFYSEEYIRAWTEVATALPGVTLWAYTRSWQRPDLLDGLRRLAELPNFHLWLSCDRDSGPPPRLGRARACWLQVGDEPPPAPLPGHAPVELVFRTRRDGRRPAKRVGAALVCPTHNGTPAGAAVTCESCAFCWTART